MDLMLTSKEKVQSPENLVDVIYARVPPLADKLVHCVFIELNEKMS